MSQEVALGTLCGFVLFLVIADFFTVWLQRVLLQMQDRQRASFY